MKIGDIVRVLGVDSGQSAEMSDLQPVGYSIDSRTVRAGELFFAIRGENHDGHRFVTDALQKGAVAAVVAGDFKLAAAPGSIGDFALRPAPYPATQPLESKLIRVRDTLVALQTLASAILQSWTGRTVAVTGSSGKTTTKEIAAHLLSKIGRVNKSTGNLNNHYGLPLSVLKMESDDKRAEDFDFAVLEMGMNHKGEIARLAEIAPPDVGVVTNVAPVHLEFFRSIDAIAEAKAEIVFGAKPGGTVVLNADDERVARMAMLRRDIRSMTFGIEKQADVMAREIRTDRLISTRFLLLTPNGSAEVSLPLLGRHNVYNALAGAAVAELCGASLQDIAEALAGCHSFKMRGEVLRLSGGITVIDDSYNSNPRALAEMVDMLSAADATRRVVVAGEMLELGQSGPQLHCEAGRHVAGRNIDLLIGVRGLAAELVACAKEAGMSSTAFFCETPQEAADLLVERLQPGDTVLVKGSRGVKTEAVVERIRQQFDR